MHTTLPLRSAALAGVLAASMAGCTRTGTHPAALVSAGAGTVSVVAAAARTTYTGQCPPSADRAPTFEAIISVSEGPVTVTYQWLTGVGGSTDPSPKVLTFGGRGPQYAVVSFIETGYVPDSTRSDWAAVFVRSPLGVESNHLPFTTTCHTAGPHRLDPDLDTAKTS